MRSIGIIVLSFSALAMGLLSCTSKTADNVPTVTIGLQANVKGMDPIHTGDVYSSNVVQQIYETLFQYHYLKRPLTLEPLLAASMPEISKDGLTHTIKLKSGVRFQDSPAFPDGKGRVVVADDFIYSWKRLADPKNQSEGFWIFDGKVKGFHEWREKVQKGEANYFTPVEGLEAPDANTIVIKLERPYYQLEYVLAHPFSAVVAREVVEKFDKEFLNNPVGTGPFVLESWVRNSKIVLKRNPNWHGGTYPSDGEAGDAERGLLKDAGKPIPFIEKIVMEEVIEDQPRWLNFMKGQYDYAGIPKDNFDGAVKDGALVPELVQKGIVLNVVNEMDVTYTAFNMEDPILGKNLNLRRALAHALDEKTLIQKFFNNRAISAQSLIPPDMDTYDPKYKNPNQEFNLTKAKEFLVKAGYPEGKGLPELEFLSVTSSTGRQMAEFYQQCFGAIGVKLKIVTVSWPQFLEKLRMRKMQIAGAAWLGDYPDPENFYQLLYGKNVSPGPNNTNFNNKEFNALYEKAVILPPGTERDAIYTKMRDIASEQAPMIFGSHRQGWYLKQGWLENFKENATIHTKFKYLRINAEKKAELKAKL